MFVFLNLPEPIFLHRTPNRLCQLRLHIVCLNPHFSLQTPENAVAFSKVRLPHPVADEGCDGMAQRVGGINDLNRLCRGTVRVIVYVLLGSSPALGVMHTTQV